MKILSRGGVENLPLVWVDDKVYRSVKDVIHRVVVGNIIKLDVMNSDAIMFTENINDPPIFNPSRGWMEIIHINQWSNKIGGEWKRWHRVLDVIGMYYPEQIYKDGSKMYACSWDLSIYLDRWKMVSRDQYMYRGVEYSYSGLLDTWKSEALIMNVGDMDNKGGDVDGV